MGSITNLAHFDSAMASLYDGCLRSMRLAGVFVEFFLRDPLLLVAEGGQLEDHLLLGSHDDEGRSGVMKWFN